MTDVEGRIEQAVDDKLQVHDNAPLNAEPDAQDLTRGGFVTPVELLFKRNHGEVQHRPADHRVKLVWLPEVLGKLSEKTRASMKEQTYTAAQLEERVQTEITAVLQVRFSTVALLL